MGEGHLQGKTEFGGDSSKVGTSKSNDFVTGPCRPFLPHDSQASPPFSLVCRVAALQGEEGHLGALIGDRREAVGLCPTPPTPGMLADSGHFFSSVQTQSRGKGSHTLSLGFPAWGGSDFYTPVRPNPQIPSLQITSSPPPWVQSAIQWGPGMGASWVPTRFCPGNKGSGVPSVGVPAAPELGGQARRRRSVLGRWCPRPS